MTNLTRDEVVELLGDIIANETAKTIWEDTDFYALAAKAYDALIKAGVIPMPPNMSDKPACESKQIKSEDQDSRKEQRRKSGLLQDLRYVKEILHNKDRRRTPINTSHCTTKRGCYFERRNSL
jgi:hypothetical protein